MEIGNSMGERLVQRALRLLFDPKRLSQKLRSFYLSRLEGYYTYLLRHQHPETYQVIAKIQQSSALFGGSYKYLHLHRLLERYKPRMILEFGSGSSTGVFAEYTQNENTFAWTVEDNPVWLKNTQDSMGNAADRITFILAPAENQRGNPSRCFYRFETDQAFDFVYIDGPPLVVDGKDDGTAVNWNVVQLIESGYAPRIIVVDGRVSTVQYLVKNYSNYYKVFLRDTGFLKPGYNHHSVFVKRQI